METRTGVEVIIKNRRAMFKYLFYRIFRFQHKIIGEDRNMAALSSIFSITFLIAMNIASFGIFIWKYTNVLSNAIDNFNVFFGTTKAMPIAFATIVLIPVYFIFYHKKKYEKIIKKVENSNKKQRTINNIFAIAYQIITVVLFVYIAFY